ncbi:MAG: bacterial transcriptional activator domain-containing protein [Acidiferrobacterales bacterium]
MPRFKRLVNSQRAGSPTEDLEADNVAEGLYRHLIIFCQQLGRQAEAIKTYNRCRKTLSAVLKVEPAPETKAIYERLLHQA